MTVGRQTPSSDSGATLQPPATHFAYYLSFSGRRRISCCPAEQRPCWILLRLFLSHFGFKIDIMATKVDIGPNDDSVFLQLAGRKLKNRLGSTLNEGSGGSTVPAFAKKQLEKLGWKPGEGLGKRRQGMVSHIKVTKRAEGLGLGESTLDPAIAQSDRKSVV